VTIRPFQELLWADQQIIIVGQAAVASASVKVRAEIEN